jgi:hypothetical protein
VARGRHAEGNRSRFTRHWITEDRQAAPAAL